MAIASMAVPVAASVETRTTIADPATVTVGWTVTNVGTGAGLTLRDILRQIVSVVELEPSVNWLPSRTFDVPRIVLDASKLKAATGWNCTTTLQEGIAITAEWLRETDI